ncbi:hypothetical protein CC85DRAFT_283555 [Cutaneotrichosporon oleaginosum]|uniref:F-box domain-containing protein n=1 Tax=Cutaneotrichosporon oleaginosum TaxID=879819 RepID=A0A0J0XTA0_9TREE|nr:uncharacterized protein CC85DRAFT_283555 [Cutaneotrichosporon oleaginosum]KLT44311.1 hypothetical protein CC85DRAFT_283555 [Cutaneotrichosporon oleaginosum]TXT07961.1 hypothetical protein COLE_04885 [Cutaneotrichosporon oleaginosum]
MLDYAYFPHIVEDALRRTDHTTLLALRLVNRRIKNLAEAELFSHVLFTRAPGGKAYVLRAADGKLPVPAWPTTDLPCPPDGDAARLLRLLAHTRVLDIHTSPPPGGPLLAALARVPTRRSQHHHSPAARGTFVHEYAVYMASHWRERRFCFDPPAGTERYVVHVRHHTNRTLHELYGPAPSAERILSRGPSARGTPPPAYILVFSGCPEPCAPSVPTHGAAAGQRRIVHTLLYEFAEQFEALRRAQRAQVTVVGAEDFVASLCGATSTEEAGRLFESKLALARRDMAGEEEDPCAPPVRYFSHGQYEALVGGRVYEAQTRPMTQRVNYFTL